MNSQNVGQAGDPDVLGACICCSRSCLHDRGDSILVSIIIVAFHHIAHILGGAPILSQCAGEGHCCEAMTVCLVEESLENRIRLDGRCLPRVEFLE